MSLLPPCNDALRMHIERANYQALIWYNASVANPEIPSPCGHGWKMEADQLEIQWTEGELMPQDLFEVLVRGEEPLDFQESLEDETPELVNLNDIVFEDC